MTNGTRLSVNMNTETAAALREIAERYDVTVTEAVRRAISVAKFIDDKVRGGSAVLVEDRSGKQRELVMM